MRLTACKFATVTELFRYKDEEFTLPKFPDGVVVSDFPYDTTDQWGIKGHNRPWMAEAGEFSAGQRIIEVGGGFSTLLLYLAEKYDLEAWVGDDFGVAANDPMWSRWGDPEKLANSTAVRYPLQPFGIFSPEYPDDYFDRVFTVSTLEHIPGDKILDVARDMNRVMKPGGKQLHSIDIMYDHPNTIGNWLLMFEQSGVDISMAKDAQFQMLNIQSSEVLKESYDVVYRYHPPKGKSKAYHPAASLLLEFTDEG